MLDQKTFREIVSFAVLVRDDLSKQPYPNGYHVSKRWRGILDDLMARVFATNDATDIVCVGIATFDVPAWVLTDDAAASLRDSRTGYVAKYPELRPIGETSFIPSNCTVSVDGVTFSPKLQQTFSYYDEIVTGMGGNRPMGVVVEVGSGYGKLMRVLHSLGTRCCVLVDLPEALLFGFAFLRANFPDCKMHIIRTAADVTADMAEHYDFIFCPIQQFHNLRLPCVDLLVNAYSFAEMTQGCVDHIVACAETLKPQFLWSFNLVFSDKTIHYDTGGLDGEGNDTVLPVGPMWWPQRTVLYPTILEGKYRITGSVTLARRLISEAEMAHLLAWNNSDCPANGDRLMRTYFAALWSANAELADQFFAELRVFCAAQNFGPVVGFDFERIGEVKHLRARLAAVKTTFFRRLLSKLAGIGEFTRRLVNGAAPGR